MAAGPLVPSARSFGSAWSSLKGGSIFKTDGGPTIDEPPSTGFAGFKGQMNTRGRDNDSTMDHARKPVNMTYMVDLDGTGMPMNYERRKKYPGKASLPDRKTYNTKNQIARGEINKQDVICFRRISSHRDGISHAVKSVAAWNMYMRTDEAREYYGKERHHGKVTDDWDCCSMVQVGRIQEYKWQRYTAFSVVFSTSGPVSVGNVWLACQHQSKHKFTKRTANEGEYVGYMLQRLRYIDPVDEACMIIDPATKRQRLDSDGNAAVTGRARPSIATRRKNEPNKPLWQLYDEEEVQEETSGFEHYWCLVPYISPFADGPPVEYYMNQHFTGKLFPCGIVMESYAPSVNPRKWDADHGLYASFPWMEPGHEHGWREKYMTHREPCASLTVIFGVNCNRLYC